MPTWVMVCIVITWVVIFMDLCVRIYSLASMHFDLSARVSKLEDIVKQQTRPRVNPL